MLTNKTIVVTGAASGIGAETARTIKAQGATVIGVDRNEPADHIDRYVSVDLSDPASIDTCILEVGSGIDALCNIAGLPPTAGHVPVVTVNFLGLRYFTLGMIDNLNDGASIVNMASLAGIGWPQAAESVKSFIAESNFDNVKELCDNHNVDDARCYFFSKESLVVWTMMNRWTWRDRGIRMNTVSPGPVETPILPDFLETLGERAEEDMRVMDRPGTPVDVAPLVAFLCSDGSQWIRGINIPCDGGMSSHIMLHMTGIETD